MIILVNSVKDKNAQLKYQNKIEINNEKEINVQVYQN
jgi:hypothetical protein